MNEQNRIWEKLARKAFRPLFSSSYKSFWFTCKGSRVFDEDQ